MIMVWQQALPVLNFKDAGSTAFTGRGIQLQTMHLRAGDRMCWKGQRPNIFSSSGLCTSLSLCVCVHTHLLACTHGKTAFHTALNLCQLCASLSAIPLATGKQNPCGMSWPLAGEETLAFLEQQHQEEEALKTILCGF